MEKKGDKIKDPFVKFLEDATKSWSSTVRDNTGSYLSATSGLDEEYTRGVYGASDLVIVFKMNDYFENLEFFKIHKTIINFSAEKWSMLNKECGIYSS